MGVQAVPFPLSAIVLLRCGVSIIIVIICGFLFVVISADVLTDALHLLSSFETTVVNMGESSASYVTVHTCSA